MSYLAENRGAFISSSYSVSRNPLRDVARRQYLCGTSTTKGERGKLGQLSRPAVAKIRLSIKRSVQGASESQKSSLPQSSITSLRLGVLTWLSALLVPTALAYLDATTTHGSLNEHLGRYSSHYFMVVYNALFALLHSGLASLRPWLTKFTGERLYRVGFALASLPSAVALIGFFIAHRYDGRQLWLLQGVPYMHELCYVITFVSFLFLYPATFNLLEVAAVKKPSFRIYETGIIRITRHPQLTGQVLWCLAHGAWMGTSFTLVACLTLIAQHLVGAWNGDRRLRDRYGQEWTRYSERTSILPFASIIDGKQELRLNEFGFGYLGVVAFVVGTYVAHPWMLRVVGELQW